MHTRAILKKSNEYVIGLFFFNVPDCIETMHIPAPELGQADIPGTNFFFFLCKVWSISLINTAQERKDG